MFTCQKFLFDSGIFKLICFNKFSKRIALVLFASVFWGGVNQLKSQGRDLSSEGPGFPAAGTLPEESSRGPSAQNIPKVLCSKDWAELSTLPHHLLTRILWAVPSVGPDFSG